MEEREGLYSFWEEGVYRYGGYMGRKEEREALMPCDGQRLGGREREVHEGEEEKIYEAMKILYTERNMQEEK